MALIGFSFGGVAHGVKNVLLRTLIHERAPEALRGRAFAAYNGARNGAELGALALGGIVVGALGARAALLVAGARAGRDRRRLPAASHRAAAPRRRSPPTKGESSMHVSKDELEPMVIGEYEGRRSTPARCASRSSRCRRTSRPTSRRSRACPTIAASAITGATCSRARSASPTSTGPRRSSAPARPTTCGPGHFVQTLEPVELIELSPVDEHDRTMATIARNMGLVTS